MNNSNNGYCGRILLKKYNNYIYTHICNITNLSKYEIIEEKENYTKYKLLDDLRINSINKSQSIQLDRITHFIVKSNFKELNQVNYVSDFFYTNGLIVFDKKESKTKYVTHKRFENNYFISVYNTLEKREGLKVNDGICYAIYLLYFNRIEKNKIHFNKPDFPLANATLLANFSDMTITDAGAELIIESEDFRKFISDYNFYYNINVIAESDEFLYGILYGLLEFGGSISKDEKNTFYIIFRGLEKKQILNISYVFRYRFNIMSKTIIRENLSCLSMKINDKLLNILADGYKKDYIKEDVDSYVQSSKTKEIFIKDFRIVPWYKMSYEMDDKESKLYTFELENNNVFMLSNGLFTLV